MTDRIREAAVAAGAAIIGDRVNVNGRFVVVKSSNPREAIRTIRNAIKGHFAHCSNPSVWRENGVEEWSFQVTTKVPSILASSVIYRKDEFGQTTHITVRS